MSCCNPRRSSPGLRVAQEAGWEEFPGLCKGCVLRGGAATSLALNQVMLRRALQASSDSSALLLSPDNYLMRV